MSGGVMKMDVATLVGDDAAQDTSVWFGMTEL
jgi:hypothetical protein